MKILIIEDDKSLVETLKEILEQEKYFVDYYYNLDDIEDYVILNLNYSQLCRESG